VDRLLGTASGVDDTCLNDWDVLNDDNGRDKNVEFFFEDMELTTDPREIGCPQSMELMSEAVTEPPNSSTD